MTRTLIGIAATMLAASAQAQTTMIIIQDVPSARVSGAGLDLHSAAGRAVMEERVHLAAEALCLDRAIDPLDVRLRQMQCYRTALASGFAQLDALSG
jgi:UrcA family protein